MPKSVIVIPCYNEADRLKAEHCLQLVESPDNHVLLVDDGSSDGTPELLEEISAQSERIFVHTMPQNGGKAEAVRAGLHFGLEAGADIVGYLDADMATPPEEILSMLAAMDDGVVKVVLGSRVQLLGRRVNRQPFRHYLGRGFATVASWALQLSVYDTQCGSKLLRDTPALRHAIVEPFTSRWVFDVELFGRLLSAPEPLSVHEFLEVPLQRWEDVAGSKLTWSGMATAGLDLGRIALRRRSGR